MLVGSSEVAVAVGGAAGGAAATVRSTACVMAASWPPCVARLPSCCTIIGDGEGSGEGSGGEASGKAGDGEAGGGWPAARARNSTVTLAWECGQVRWIR